MSLSENHNRPVLLRITFDGALARPPLECHATGETGDCGHPLAECPDPGCPGGMCPQCGQWLCAEHQAFREAVQNVIREGMERLSQEVRDG